MCERPRKTQTTGGEEADFIECRLRRPSPRSFLARRRMARRATACFELFQSMIAVEEKAPQPAPGAPSSTENVVAVRGLTKVFKDFWGRPKARAVENVDFEVRPGAGFGLLGPNGPGKSATVKLLLGLLYPTKGHIEVFGHSPRHVATKSRIGYLPEESYLYRYLNSGETLDFFGSLFDLPSQERRRRAEQLLAM